MNTEVIRPALTMLGYGLVAVALITLAAVFAQRLGARLEEGRALDVTMTATVLGKRTRMPTRAEQETDGVTTMQHYVTFEPDSGRPIELVVDEEAYGAIREGDHGYLTVRDKRFCGFVPDDGVAKP
ncbi:MAG: DUF2500 domain-containing protein [Aristaeellaceae bacterium]